MADKSHYIYGLHSGDSNYRYIGRSTNPSRRFSSHRVAALEGDDAPVYDWVREIGIENLCQDVLAGPISTRVGSVENDWAYFFRQQGYDLFNAESIGGAASGVCKQKKRQRRVKTRRSAQTRYHTKRGVYREQCRFCREDAGISTTTTINREPCAGTHRPYIEPRPTAYGAGATGRTPNGATVGGSPGPRYPYPGMVWVPQDLAPTPQGRAYTGMVWIPKVAQESSSSSSSSRVVVVE